MTEPRWWEQEEEACSLGSLLARGQLQWHQARAYWVPNLMACGYGDSTVVPATPSSHLPAPGVKFRNVSSFPGQAQDVPSLGRLFYASLWPIEGPALRVGTDECQQACIVICGFINTKA